MNEKANSKCNCSKPGNSHLEFTHAYGNGLCYIIMMAILPISPFPTQIN